MLSSVGAGAGAGPGCGAHCRRQSDTLLVHSFSLRAHDEAEEVLVWYGGPSDRRRGGGTALVIQTGPLERQNMSLRFNYGF